MKQWLMLFLLCLTSQAFTQNILDTKLNKLYTGTLSKVLTDIASEHAIKFTYKTGLLDDIRIIERPMNQTLSSFLKTVLKSTRLKYFLDETGTIHIISENEKVETKSFTQAEKKFSGLPTKSRFNISGRIIDGLTGESLPFATIKVKDGKQGTTSNVDGYFTLFNVPTDTNTLICSYLGYHESRVYLHPEFVTENVEIELTPTSIELDAVLITAEKEELLQANGQVSMLKMTPSKLALLPSLGEKDIFRSFQLMPGVSAANEHTSGLYVRGGTPDQALTLFDGFTVYNVDHLFGFYSAFNANAIKDVQLYKGAFDAKYGGRLSSVVEITGKEGNSRTANAGADISLLSLNTFAEAPLGKNITMISAVRRSWRSPLYNNIFDNFSGENESNTPFGSQFGTKTQSYFYDINAKLTWQPGNKDIVSLSFYNGKDNLDNSIKPELPSFLLDDSNFSLNITDKTDWGNTGTSLKWSKKWSERLYSNTLLGFSTYFSNRNRSVEGGFTDAGGVEQKIQRGTLENSDLLDYSGKVDVEYKLNSWSRLELGAFITYNDISYQYAQNDTSFIIDRQTSGIISGGYIQEKFHFLNNKLTLNPGIRYSFFSETQKGYSEPRFSFQYAFSDKLTLKGSAGKYYQFAKRVVREDILEGSRDFWVLSDNNRLPVASNEQFVIGASYENDKWLFDVEAYTKELNGLSEYSLRFTPSQTQINYEEYFYVGKGTAKGIDFLLQKKYGKWNGWIGYTLGDVRNNFSVYGEEDYYASNDVTHEFKTVHLYKMGNWDLSATFILATGKPYTAPDGGYELDLLNGNTEDYLNVSAKNGLRLPTYHRLDLAATYSFKFSNKLPASLGLSIFNVYNRQNVWYKTFEIVNSSLVGVDVNYLGFTPNLNFSIKLK